MKKRNINSTEDSILRQKAVELLKNEPSRPGSPLSEADILQLIHELEVHQIELELQNEELKRAKKREAELAVEKYIELYDFAPSGYFTLSKEGKIIDINLSGANMLGKVRTSLKNNRFGFFVTNDTKPAFNLFLEKIFTNKAKETCEVALMSVEKLTTYVHLTGKVSENGENCHLTVLDITERKWAEEALRESEEKYRTIFENVQDVFYQLDLEGKILDISPSIKRHSEFYRDEMIHTPISNLYLNPYDSENLLNEIMRNFELRDYELRLKTKTDAVKHVSINARLIFDSQGNPNHIDGVIRDITERIQAQQELISAKEKAEESDQLKSAFLANMSHEIRTPLNGILGFSQMMKDPDLTIEKKERYINIIERSGNRMLNIINDILDISKIESGQMKVSISKTNINEQIKYIYSFFKPEIEHKGLQIFFTTGLPFKKAWISTDKEKIDAILTNLVKNAIKFTQTGYVEFGYNVKCAEPARIGEPVEKDELTNELIELEFFVKDTGVGMRQEQLKFVFERFRQGSNLLTRNYEGSGLGLSISKAYVEMLGGDIWVESDPGEGSVFYFTIPYKVEPEEEMVAKNEVPADSEDPPMNKLKILIAEDDEYSETLIIMAVERFCKKLLKVSSGIDAVETCRINSDIDLVLMDVKMPGMDGFEAVRQIRQFNKNVVIIAQTAYGNTNKQAKAIESGCNDYVSKPLSIAALISVIKKQFSKHPETKATEK